MGTRLGAPARIGVLALMLCLGAAACGPGTSTGLGTPTPGGSAPSAGPGDGSPPAGGTVIPETTLAQVVQDAASRTGGDASAVVVVEARAVTWPNGAAGCPQPDMMYTDALVPGYWVLVESAGQTFDYRGAQRSGTLQLCADPGPVPEASDAS